MKEYHGVIMGFLGRALYKEPWVSCCCGGVVLEVAAL